MSTADRASAFFSMEDLEADIGAAAAKAHFVRMAVI